MRCAGVEGGLWWQKLSARVLRCGRPSFGTTRTRRRSASCAMLRSSTDALRWCAQPHCWNPRQVGPVAASARGAHSACLLARRADEPFTCDRTRLQAGFVGYCAQANGVKFPWEPFASITTTSPPEQVRTPTRPKAAARPNASQRLRSHAVCRSLAPLCHLRHGFAVGRAGGGGENPDHPRHWLPRVVVRTAPGAGGEALHEGEGPSRTHTNAQARAAPHCPLRTRC